MWVRNARDLGLLIRQRRHRLSITQADLADRIGATRHWVMRVEAGKPKVELGLVLNALSALGLVCDLRPKTTDPSSGERASRPDSPHSGPGTAASRPPSDLSRVLSRTRTPKKKA